MATVFAFASYLGTLIVLGIICFGLGRFNPKYGAEGSFLVMAVSFAILLPVAALGFYLAKRSFEHRARAVAVAGLVSGVAAALLVLLCDWIFSGQTRDLSSAALRRFHRGLRHGALDGVGAQA